MTARDTTFGAAQPPRRPRTPLATPARHAEPRLDPPWFEGGGGGATGGAGDRAVLGLELLALRLGHLCGGSWARVDALMYARITVDIFCRFGTQII